MVFSGIAFEAPPSAITSGRRRPVVVSLRSGMALSSGADASPRHGTTPRPARSATVFRDSLRRRGTHSRLRPAADRSQPRHLCRSGAGLDSRAPPGPLYGVERPVRRAGAVVADPPAARLPGGDRLGGPARDSGGRPPAAGRG